MNVFLKIILTLTLLNTLSLTTHARDKGTEDRFNEVPTKTESISPMGRKELLKEQERQMQEEGPVLLEKQDEKRENKELKKRQNYYSH